MLLPVLHVPGQAAAALHPPDQVQHQVRRVREDHQHRHHRKTVLLLRRKQGLHGLLLRPGDTRRQEEEDGRPVVTIY